MSERIDISRHVKELCETLGVEYDLVYRITIRPSDATVTVSRFQTSEHGEMHIEDGEPVREQLEFSVMT